MILLRCFLALLMFAALICILKTAFEWGAKPPKNTKENSPQSKEKPEEKKESKNQFVWKEGYYYVIRCACCGKEISFNENTYLRQALEQKHWVIRYSKPYCPSCAYLKNKNNTSEIKTDDNVPLGEKEFV